MHALRVCGVFMCWPVERLTLSSSSRDAKTLNKHITTHHGAGMFESLAVPPREVLEIMESSFPSSSDSPQYASSSSSSPSSSPLSSISSDDQYSPQSSQYSFPSLLSSAGNDTLVPATDAWVSWLSQEFLLQEPYDMRHPSSSNHSSLASTSFAFAPQVQQTVEQSFMGTMDSWYPEFDGSFSNEIALDFDISAFAQCAPSMPSWQEYSSVVVGQDDCFPVAAHPAP